MKKTSVLRMTAIGLSMALLLGGCSAPNIPFLNKDKGNNQTSEVDDSDLLPTSKIIPNDGLTFTVGDIVTFDSLASMSAEDEGNALQKVIMYSDGTITESYEFTETGIQNVLVAVQFLDGSSDTNQVTVEVVEREINLPDELVNHIKTGNWDIRNIASFDDSLDSSPLVSMSYNTNALLVDDYSMGIAYQTSDKEVLYTSYITPDMVSEYKRNGFDLFSKDVSLRVAASFLTAMTGDDADEEAQKMIQFFNWYADWYESATTAAKVESGLSLYDVDGNGYPIYITEYTVNLAPIADESVSFAGPAYIEYNGNRIFLVLQSEAVISDGSGMYEEAGNSDVELPTTYEEFLNFLKDNTDASDYSNLGVSVNEVNNRLKNIVNDVVLGDVTPLLPLAPPDATVVAGESGEEELEEVGAVADTFIPYSQKYPQIYRWPANDTVYTRWVYIIDNSTQFVSSIINPDGTTLISGFDDGTDWRLQMGTDGTTTSTGGSTSTGGGVDEQTYTINSSYAAYDIVTSGMTGSTIDEDYSTSGRVVIKYNGNTYYIETVRVTQIQSYMANSLYSTDLYKDGAFRVHEDDKSTTTNGEITSYKVSYKTGANADKDSAYMAVYNVHNDYLCCYGDNLPTDDNIFITILKNMVVIK